MNAPLPGRLLQPDETRPAWDPPPLGTEHRRWIVEDADAGLLPPRLAQLAHHWLGCRNGRDVPRRADIDPGQLKSILPHMVILGLERTGGTLAGTRIRLMGTGLVRIYGADWTGRTSHDFHREDALADHLARLQEIADRRRPMHWRQWSRAQGCEDLFAERLLCPLTGAGDTVESVVGIIQFPGMENDPRVREGFGPLTLGAAA